MAEPKQQEKKKKTGFFRGVLSTFFDVPRWVNVEEYVRTNRTLKEKLADTFRIAKAKRQETFEAAMQRLQLTEKDIERRVAQNRRMILIMLLFMVFLSAYCLYLLFHAAFAGTLIALALIFLSAVRAFQCSFWNFQIKNRRLGCRFEDWLKSKVSEKI